MSPKQILINRRGTTIAIVMAISALAGGALSGLFTRITHKNGISDSLSGYGWYSLSGIVLTGCVWPGNW